MRLSFVSQPGCARPADAIMTSSQCEVFVTNMSRLCSIFLIAMFAGEALLQGQVNLRHKALRDWLSRGVSLGSCVAVCKQLAQ